MLKTFLFAIMSVGPNAGTTHLHDQHATQAACHAKARALTHAYYNGLATAFCLTLPPCEYEDAQNCYWDARKRGNRKGQSFVDLHGTAHYVEIQ